MVPVNVHVAVPSFNFGASGVVPQLTPDTDTLYITASNVPEPNDILPLKVNASANCTYDPGLNIKKVPPAKAVPLLVIVCVPIFENAKVPKLPNQVTPVPFFKLP